MIALSFTRCFAFVLIFLSSWAALAHSSLKCTKYTSPFLGKDVTYCVDRSTPDTPAQPGEPVVYFMHGTHGGASTWTKNNYKNSLEELRKSGPMKPMTFVSFDTQPYSFFSDYPMPKGSTDNSRSYETWFLKEFMPYVEKTLNVCHERSCRGIMGESMGGFGAIKTALRHPELFSTVAVNSPALAPFADDPPKAVWKKYFESQPIGSLKGRMLVNIVFNFFPTPEILESNNPLWLVENYSSSYAFPALYLDMGKLDNYGFYTGFVLLKQALDQRNFAYSSNCDQDGHHDMWKRHASDAINFLQAHVGN